MRVFEHNNADGEKLSAISDELVDLLQLYTRSPVAAHNVAGDAQQLFDLMFILRNTLKENLERFDTSKNNDYRCVEILANSKDSQGKYSSEESNDLVRDDIPQHAHQSVQPCSKSLHPITPREGSAMDNRSFSFSNIRKEESSPSSISEISLWKEGDTVQMFDYTTGKWLVGSVYRVHSSCDSLRYDIQLSNGDKELGVWPHRLRRVPRDYKDCFDLIDIDRSNFCTTNRRSFDGEDIASATFTSTHIPLATNNNTSQGSARRRRSPPSWFIPSRDEAPKDEPVDVGATTRTTSRLRTLPTIGDTAAIRSALPASTATTAHNLRCNIKGAGTRNKTTTKPASTQPTTATSTKAKPLATVKNCTPSASESAILRAATSTTFTTTREMTDGLVVLLFVILFLVLCPIMR